MNLFLQMVININTTLKFLLLHFGINGCVMELHYVVYLKSYSASIIILQHPERLLLIFLITAKGNPKC